MDAAAWDERYAASELVWSAGPNQFVESELAGLPPGRALDLACGEGRNARWLAGRGWRVTAMDFSATAVEKGRRLDAERGVEVEWQVGDAVSAELPADLDLVVIAYLQIGDDERRRVWRRAFESLAPGGRFLLVGHDSTNLTEGTGGPQDPAVLYTAEDVLAALGDESSASPAYEIVRAERVGRQVGEDLAWDVLVHLVRA